MGHLEAQEGQLDRPEGYMDRLEGLEEQEAHKDQEALVVAEWEDQVGQAQVVEVVVEPSEQEVALVAPQNSLVAANNSRLRRNCQSTRS